MHIRLEIRDPLIEVLPEGRQLAIELGRKTTFEDIARAQHARTEHGEAERQTAGDGDSARCQKTMRPRWAACRMILNRVRRGSRLRSHGLVDGADRPLDLRRELADPLFVPRESACLPLDTQELRDVATITLDPLRVGAERCRQGVLDRGEPELAGPL